MEIQSKTTLKIVNCEFTDLEKEQRAILRERIELNWPYGIGL